MSSLFYLRFGLLLGLLNGAAFISSAQSFLNDGDLELYKSGIAPSSVCDDNSDPVTCITTGTETYNNLCPGGYSSVKEKMLFWSDRDATGCDGTVFCSPHSPDWIYIDPTTSYFTGILGITGVPKSGYGAIGAAPYELFQQEMAQPVNKSGNYIISAWIKTNTVRWFTSDGSHTYNIDFILGNGPATYTGETCSDIIDGATSGYTTVNNVGFSTSKNVTSPIGDWTLIELPITLSSPNFNWFSVNVSTPLGKDGDCGGHAYFGFDQVYISQVGCYCPFETHVMDQTFTDIQTGAEAQNYLNLVSGNAVVTDGSNPVNVLFTAGKAITVTSGFNTEPGVTAEIKIANCFSNTPDAAFTIRNPYPVCPNSDGTLNFCFETKNITNFKFELSDDLDPPFVNTSGEINTTIFNAEGYNVTCFTIPYLDDQDVFYMFEGIGCNGASINQDGEIWISDACFDILGPHNRDTTEKKSEDNKIKIFPNPFCSAVLISSPNFSLGDVALVIDATGRIINRIGITEQNTQLGLDAVESGIYFIKYEGLNCSITQKFAKTCE